nr:ATP-binding protein [Dehalococcoides mccartyi]
MSVEDTGGKIMEMKLTYTFEYFCWLDKSRTRYTGGSGLGVSIVKRLVKAYGGTILMNSSLGNDTRLGQIYRFKSGKNIYCAWGWNHHFLQPGLRQLFVRYVPG